MTSPLELGDLQLFLLRQKSDALERGFFLEAVSICYIQLELGLRQLLSTNVGTAKDKIDEETVDSKQSLAEVATLAREGGFINQQIFDMIERFETLRNDAVGGLSSGLITYKDIEEPTKTIINLGMEIQKQWLMNKFAPRDRNTGAR